MIPKPAWYDEDDLQGFERWCWSLVARGVRDRRSPFHTPTLGTVGREGMPDLRTLVLREADEGERRLRFHTDRRAAKVEQIGADPHVAVHFYDGGKKLQLRLVGTAQVQFDQGSRADEAWEATRSFSRACYRVAPPPGTAIHEGGAYAMSDGEDEDDGREAFAIIVVDVTSVEALYLAADGHRRARFGNDPTWLVP